MSWEAILDELLPKEDALDEDALGADALDE